ncbi:hypothetical protein Tco_1024843 [Tanacetum coccineum]
MSCSLMRTPLITTIGIKSSGYIAEDCCCETRATISIQSSHRSQPKACVEHSDIEGCISERKLTTNCKGYYFNVSMLDIVVNKLHHLEYAYGSTSWNSWSLGCEDLVLQIENLKTGKEMWEAIKTRNLGADCVKEARLQTLIMEFENLKMSNNDTINAYAAKLSGIASKLATVGEVMSEHKLVKKFLTSLPRRVVHITAAIEQVLYLKATRFEDVVGRLEAYEERVKEEDKANDPQENSLYDRTEYSNGNDDLSEGRERGSYSRGCRRGRG